MTLGQPAVPRTAHVDRRSWNSTITSCNFLSSLLKLSSWPLLRTSGMSCHRAKAEPRDERKELDGERLDGDGVPSDPSSLSPSSSWPGSFPCCLWISLLMATSLYSWYRIAAGKGMARNVKQEIQQSVSLELGQKIKETYSLVKNVISDWNWKQLEGSWGPPPWIFSSFCKIKQELLNWCPFIVVPLLF